MSKFDYEDSDLFQEHKIQERYGLLGFGCQRIYRNVGGYIFDFSKALSDLFCSNSSKVKKRGKVCRWQIQDLYTISMTS